MSVPARLRSPAFKLAGFAVILAAVFGAGAAVGAAVGPALDGRLDTTVPVVDHDAHDG
jgi:hypothetical protein